MKNLDLKFALLGVAMIATAACGDDHDDDHHNDAGPAPVADAGVVPATDAGTTPTPIEVPTTYNFDSRFEEGTSPLSYSGQIARHVILKGLSTELGAMTDAIDSQDFVPAAGDARAKLDFYFRFDGETSGDLAHNVSTTPAPLQTTYNEVSTNKNLVGKLAGNDSATDYKDWSAGLEGWPITGPGCYNMGEHRCLPGVNAEADCTAPGTMWVADGCSTGERHTPEALVGVFFDMIDAAAVARAAGEIPTDPAGNAISKVYVTAQGHDLSQIIAKFVAMGVFFAQGTDDYLDSDVDGKGLLASNAQYVKDGVAKPYSALGHAWDEGFGYFGAARDYNDYTDDESAGKGGRDGWSSGYYDTNGDSKIDLKSEFNHGHSRNCAKRDRGSAESAKTDFTKEAMDHFLAGRTLILNAGDTLTDDEMTQLKAHRDTVVMTWEKCIAATALHYINDTLQDMAKFGTDDYNFANHAKHWSELKGFALGLQFNPRSPLNETMEGVDHSYFHQLHKKIGTAPALPGARNVDSYKDELREARSMLAERYGFAAANVGDANGEGGW